MLFGDVEVLCYPSLERQVWLELEDTECSEIRCRPILVVEGGQVEALMVGERSVGDNFGGEIQVLFLAFALLRLLLNPFFF